MKTLTTTILALLVLTATAQIHVTPTGAGTATGTNWANATTLEQAVAIAPSGTAIWVQAGTYNPSATLLVLQGVRLYGGFAGTETALSQRNFAENPTIIDAGHQFAVVTLGADAVLSGVTVQNGVASSATRMSGGGVLMQARSRIEHSYILNNVALHYGGGVYAASDAEIFNSVIANNSAGISGFAVAGGAINFIGNTVTGNSVLDCEGYADVSSSQTVCYGETVTLVASISGVDYLWNTGETTSFITTPELTANATFSVTINTPTFCVVTETFEITINPVPTVTVIASPTTANPGETVTFTATANLPGGTFLWDDPLATTTSSLTAEMPVIGNLQFTVTYELDGCTSVPYTATSLNTNCVAPSIAGAVLTVDDPDLCYGSSTTIRLTGGTVNSGEWVLYAMFCGAMEIERSSENEPAFTVDPTTATMFFVRGEGCDQQTACEQVLVNILPAPMPTTAPSATVCVGQNLELTNLTFGGGTWEVGALGTGMVTIVASSPNAATIAGVSPGTASVIFTAGNGCPHVLELEVLAGPAPIVGDTNLCQGLSTPFTATPAGGTWSIAAGAAVTIDPITGEVTASSTLTGATTIRYTLASGCHVSQVVMVHQQPGAVSLATSTGQMCVNDVVALTPPNPPGGTWSITPATVAEFNAAFTQLTALQTGTAVVRYQLNDHCYATFDLTVLPPITGITHANELCAGAGPLQAFGFPAGGTWSSSNVAVGTVTAAGQFTGVSAGTFSLVYTMPNGCVLTGNPITVHPTPEVITGGTAVGVGSTLQLTSAPAGGTWSSFNPAIATVDATGLVTGVGTGATTIRYTIGTCFRDQAITVDACAVFSLTSPATSVDQTVCVGQAIQNISYFLANATTSQIAWTNAYNVPIGTPLGLNFNTASHTITGSPLQSGVFNYTISSIDHPPACTPASVSGTITVFPAVMPGAVAATTLNICQGDTPAEFISTTSGSGGNPAGSSYQWQQSTTSPAAGFSNIAGATWGTFQAGALTAAQTHFRRAFINACQTVYSNVISITASAPPMSPTATTTPNTVCAGLPNGTITISAPGATGFSLDGVTFQASPTFTGLAGGTHQIFAQNAAGCISGASVTVNNAAGNPELVGGTMAVTPSATICNPHTGGNIVISPSFTSTGTNPTFQWSVVGGAANIGTTQSLTLTAAPLLSTTYRIRVTNTDNNCYSEFDQIITVVTPLVIVTQPIGGSICVGQPSHTLAATVSPPGAHTYQWQQSTTETGTFSNIGGATSSQHVVPNSPASALWYRLQVTMVGGVCPAFHSDVVQVSVLAPPTISVTGGSRCGPGQVSLSATANPSTATIYWFDASHIFLGTTASGATFTTPYLTATGNTTFFAEANNGGCLSTRTSVTATVSPLPTITPGGGSLTQNVCAGLAMQTISFVLSGATGTTIAWTPTPPTGLNLASNTLSGVVGAAVAPGTYSFTVTATGTGAGCPMVQETGSITVIGLPPAPTVTSNNLCGSTVLTASGGGGHTIYWQGLNGAGGTSQATPTTTQTVYSNGTFHFRARTPEGCWGAAGSSGTITIQQPHNLALTGTADQTVCATVAISPITYTRTGSATVATISWTNAAGTTITQPTWVTVSSLTATPITITATPPAGTAAGTFNFTIATVATTCPSVSLTGSITVLETILGTNVGQNCNNNIPGWGCAGLGTITWGNTSNTNIESGARTVTRAGTPPANTGTGTNTQVWSGVVFATACAKGNATNSNEFNGGVAGSFNADCRQSLRSFNVNRDGRAITGDFFSWCAVRRFAAQLCPAPWRVPTTGDFRRLHWILTGAVPPAAGSWVVHGNTGAYMHTVGTNASPTAQGGANTWGGVRFAGWTGNLTGDNSRYWSSTEVSATNARFLNIGATNVNPENSYSKAIGIPLRCIR